MSKTNQLWPKYTAEQISEIIDRITTLRMGWIRQVELNSHHSKVAPFWTPIGLAASPPSKLIEVLQAHRCGSRSDGASGLDCPRLGFLRPLERQAPDHRVVAEAGADAVDGVLGDGGAAVDQVGGIGPIRRDQRA